VSADPIAATPSRSRHSRSRLTGCG
jgi:hypothetical protein